MSSFERNWIRKSPNKPKEFFRVYDEDDMHHISFRYKELDDLIDKLIEFKIKINKEN